MKIITIYYVISKYFYHYVIGFLDFSDTNTEIIAAMIKCCNFYYLYASVTKGSTGTYFRKVWIPIEIPLEIPFFCSVVDEIRWHLVDMPPTSSPNKSLTWVTQKHGNHNFALVCQTRKLVNLMKCALSNCYEISWNHLKFFGINTYFF